MLRKRFRSINVKLSGLVDGDYIDRDIHSIRGYLVPSVATDNAYGINTSDATALVITDNEALKAIGYWDNEATVYSIEVCKEYREIKEVIPYSSLKDSSYDTVVVKL